MVEGRGAPGRVSRTQSAASERGTPTIVEIETPHGLARAHLHLATTSTAALVLGHGAGGGIASRDLGSATAAALAEGVSVALVEQPYRVAGRRSPAPARQLDAAWTTVVGRLRERECSGMALITGGRSAGARVACRTAAATEAVAVLCLAFPLQPPRRSAATAAPSRLPELDQLSVPVLIVQGATDPFGMPPAAAHRTVVPVRGDHSLRSDLEAVGAAVRPWLRGVLDRAT
jgi:predicted alpha/beta-hydrolase family hydrolase